MQYSWCMYITQTHIDMRISSVNYPAPLTQYQLDSGERVCGSTNTAQMSCDSVIFPTHHFSYHYVSGKAAGFSYFHPCAFYYYKIGGQNTIDHACVSGLSIAYGPQSRCNHICIYIAGGRKVYRMAVTVPVQPTQEPAHCHLWGRTFIVNPPLTIDLLIHKTGTPTTPPSGMERTATLEAVAVTTLLLRGSGGHSRRRLQRT